MSANATISELMSPVLVTLRTERTLDEARAFLRAHNVAAAPVLSSSGTPMGVVTEFQLLKCFLKRSMQTPDKHQLMNYLTELEGVTSIKDSEAPAFGFKMMLSTPSRRIYVVNKDGALIGVLEPASFFPLVMKENARAPAEPGSRKRLMSDGTMAELSLEETIFHSAPVTLHSLDFSGKIVAANDSLHALLGYNRGELVGKTLRELYAPQYHEEVLAMLGSLKDARYKTPISAAFARKDQSLVNIDLITIIRNNDAGQAQGTITAGWLPGRAEMEDFLKALSEAPPP